MRASARLNSVKSSANGWTEGELSCFQYKYGGGGCSACPINRDYHIKPCYMFFFVMKRYEKVGFPEKLKEEFKNGY